MKMTQAKKAMDRNVNANLKLSKRIGKTLWPNRLVCKRKKLLLMLVKTLDTSTSFKRVLEKTTARV